VDSDPSLIPPPEVIAVRLGAQERRGGQKERENEPLSLQYAVHFIVGRSSPTVPLKFLLPLNLPGGRGKSDPHRVAAGEVGRSAPIPITEVRNMNGSRGRTRK